MCLGQQLESPLAHLFCRYFRSLLQLDPEPGIRGGGEQPGMHFGCLLTTWLASSRHLGCGN